MKKQYGIIFIVIVIIFSAFIITMQNNLQTNNPNVIHSNFNKTLFITYYSNSNIQYSFANNSSAIAFKPAITTTNIELNVEVNGNNYINSFFTNLLSSNAYAGSIIYLTGTVYEGTTASAFNETIPILSGSGYFGSTSFSLASRYTAANFNISVSDIYFYGSSPLMSQDTQQAYSTYFLSTPQSFLYNSISYSNGSAGFYQPTFLFSYYLSSSLTVHNAYALTFTDYTSFNLLIDGSNYTSTNNQVVISLPNGTYAYSFYINGNYSTILSDSISVYGAPRTINLAYGHSTLLSLSALIYIALSMILLIAIIRMSGNLFSVYGISSLFFLYIGYELKIQYFGITLIMTIITLLSGLFVYKVILE